VNVPLAIAVLGTGATAATARFAITTVVARSSDVVFPNRLPHAVLIVNVVGSLIGGVAAGLAASGAVSESTRLVLATGVAGGLTTFSTLAVETLQLVRAGKAPGALRSLALNLVVGLAVAVAGYAVGLQV